MSLGITTSLWLPWVQSGVGKIFFSVFAKILKKTQVQFRAEAIIKTPFPLSQEHAMSWSSVWRTCAFP